MKKLAILFLLLAGFIILGIKLSWKSHQVKNINFDDGYEISPLTPTEEPIAYTNEEECWPEDGSSWREISGCGDLRGKTIESLAKLEVNRNKINLVQTSSTKTYPKKFKSAKYRFEISYPQNFITSTSNYEIYQNLTLTGYVGSSKNVQIVIGSGQVYSTSGALCANQGCDYEAGSVVFTNGFKTNIVKSYLFVNDGKTMIPSDTKIEDYKFSVQVRDILPGFTADIYITAAFPDEDSGMEVLNILKTLR